MITYTHNTDSEIARKSLRLISRIAYYVLNSVSIYARVFPVIADGSVIAPRPANVALSVSERHDSGVPPESQRRWPGRVR